MLILYAAHELIPFRRLMLRELIVHSLKEQGFENETLTKNPVSRFAVSCLSDVFWGSLSATLLSVPMCTGLPNGTLEYLSKKNDQS